MTLAYSGVGSYSVVGACDSRVGSYSGVGSYSVVGACDSRVGLLHLFTWNPTTFFSNLLFMAFPQEMSVRVRKNLEPILF